MTRPDNITATNASGPRQLPKPTRWASRIAQFWRRVFGEIMRNRLVATIFLAVLVGGCATPNPHTVADSEIISALESGSRTSTHIALWTLKNNGFTIPKIELEKPYAEARPKLKRFAAELLRLPKSKLSQLDESLKYHGSIYSPFRFEDGQGWKQ
jgi:hypothetical protein